MIAGGAGSGGRRNEIDEGPIPLNLVVEFQEQATHSSDEGVDINKFGVEVDEVGIVAIGEVDGLVVEGDLGGP
uniref:Uncharacterized protein n=1 Tax=Fagus sylvatica TaxID=28930 RepID=A0A2N9IGU3_FAGSY